MAFRKESETLYNYDLFPKVVCVGEEVLLTIRSLGARSCFHPGENLTVRIKGIAGGRPEYFPLSADYTDVQAVCGPDGALTLTHTFAREQEYFLDLAYTDHRGREAKQRFCVYCVDRDLKGLYPYLGDLHTHTTCSDGSQDPEVVCADYHREGYDFIAITDHRRYYPSLRAMRFYESLPVEMTVLPGEEVHLPKAFGQYIDPHMISVGGRYSVNALIEREDTEPFTADPACRSLDGTCPPVMDQTAYEQTLQEVMDHADFPDGLDPVPAAGVTWAYGEIRRSGALSVFPHPYWIHDVFHVPDNLHAYLVRNRLFDAFEVLGGENYYEQNGFQTVRYYADQADGFRYPVVGSTDSHNANPTNRNALICSTLVFAPDRSCASLLDAIRAFRSVAVDTISPDFRLVGDLRLVQYACFLLREYFPIHDEACFEEGRMMKQYATGTPEEKQEALDVLTLLHGRVEKLRRKYFDF